MISSGNDVTLVLLAIKRDPGRHLQYQSSISSSDCSGSKMYLSVTPTY